MINKTTQKKKKKNGRSVYLFELPRKYYSTLWPVLFVSSFPVPAYYIKINNQILMKGKYLLLNSSTVSLQ